MPRAILSCPARWVAHGVVALLFGLLLAGCWDDGDRAPPPPAVQLAGRVVDAATGLGLDAVLVRGGGGETRSAANGRYRLDIADPRGPVAIAFWRAGYGSVERLVDASAEERAAADARLTPVSTRGTVDAGGAGQASVGTSPRALTLGLDTLVDAATGDDAIGRVDLDLSSIAVSRDWRNLGAGYRVADGAAGAAPKLLDVAGALTIDARDAAGRRLALRGGARATLLLPLDLPHFAAMSDADRANLGLFRYDPPSGRWVRHAPAAVQTAAGSAWVAAQIDRLGTWAVGRVLETVTLSGCVIDTSSGWAPGVRILADDPLAQSTASTLTDAQGRFSLVVPKPAWGNLRLVAYGADGSWGGSPVDGERLRNGDLALADCIRLRAAQHVLLLRSPDTATYDAALAGGLVQFSVVAEGFGHELSYQWFRDGVAIDGATQAFLEVPVVDGARDHNFEVEVSVRGGGVAPIRSAYARFEDRSLPVLARSPADLTVGVGQIARLDIGASGWVSAQLLRNGAPVVGGFYVGSDGRYRTPPLTLADNGASFSVRVSSRYGSVDSAAATVSVVPPSSAPGLYVLAGFSGEGYYPRSSISFADGVRSESAPKLLMVNSADTLPAGEAEPEGRAMLIAQPIRDGVVSGASVDALRTRFQPYFKDQRLYRIDLRSSGGAPAGRQVSTLDAAQLCAEALGAPSAVLDGADYVEPARSWIFLRGPGADGLCGGADDRWRAVRMGMTAADEAASIGRPLVVRRGADGRFDGLLVALGQEVQWLDADLVSRGTAFVAAAEDLVAGATTFGTTAPGQWLFASGGTVYAHDLASPTAAPVVVATLGAGEAFGPQVSDASGGVYLALGLRVLHRDAAGAVRSLGSFTMAPQSLALASSAVVGMAVELENGDFTSVIEALPLEGGTAVTLASSNGPQADLYLESMVVAGDRAFYVETQLDEYWPYRSSSGRSVGVDGSDPRSLDAYAISAAPGPLPLVGSPPVAAVFVHANGPVQGYRTAVRAIDPATGAELATYPVTDSEEYRSTLTPVPQFGAPALMKGYAPICDTHSDCGGGNYSLYFVDTAVSGSRLVAPGN